MPGKRRACGLAGRAHGAGGMLRAMRPPAAPAAALVLAGIVLAIACGSCSRAVRLSLAAPSDLTQVAGSGKSARYSRGDSIRTQDDGLLIASDDSIELYSRLGNRPASPSDTTPAIYGNRRIARELRMTGYQPVDGSWQAWEGTLRTRGDSLELVHDLSRTHPLAAAAKTDTLRIAARDVARVDLRQIDPARTAGLIVGLTALFLAIAVASLAMAVQASGLQ